VGLRTQLLLGLFVMILVTTFSVGAISVLTTRWQIAETQLTSGRIVGQALARVLAPMLRGRWTRSRSVELQRVVSGIAAWGPMRRVQVLDRSRKLLGGSRAGADEALLRQVLNIGQQRFELLQDDTVLVVGTPIVDGIHTLGVLWLEMEVGSMPLRLPAQFWVLMSVDGLLLVLFVGYVLTRYVIHPVERIQRAALRVTQGDLEASVESTGAAELTSLAESFNTMTTYLRHQLERLEQQRQALIATRAQVIRSEKLASVGRLAAGVAHEVGNPLQSILGFTEMLRRGGLTEERQQDFFDRVQSEAQRIHRIIRELLDYARPVADAVEPVQLSAVVVQAAQLLKPQRRGREVTVERVALEQLPPVAASGQRLVQVLVNLLLNAADAMDGKGTVTVRGAVVEQQVELAVGNDGPPIPLEDRGQIFDPFFTTKDPGEGTGLGLSVALSIVESFGGRLTLLDGEQTVFVITLPVWERNGPALENGTKAEQVGG